MYSAFENAGQTVGLELWRIENFEPIAYPKKNYGKFYTGDSYIILNTKKTKKSNKLSWDVHFWLGLETTQDEAGAAAMLTVHLDDLLHGVPVQHRETQDHESQLFLGYFKNGVRYEKGGVTSGFRQVETNAVEESRLFHVKGKRNVRVREVDFSVSSMNTGDCFILDHGLRILVYIGQNSKQIEQLKAIQAANLIRDQDHHGRAIIEIIDNFSFRVEKEKFFNILGSGSPEMVPDEDTIEEDSIFEVTDAASVTLYKVSDANEELEVEQISSKPLKQEMLKSEDCFILDTGNVIFVWIGREATKQEKTKSMSRAQAFIASKNYPLWTQVKRIVEGAETAAFKQYFVTWRDAGMTYSRLIRAANDEDSDTADETEFDPSVLHALKKSGGRSLGFMPDNGDGTVTMWRIENFELTEVNPEMHGMFFGGDSYVIKYQYQNKRGGQGYIIYYWQGKNSSIDEKASSAMHAVRLDNELCGKAVQVRVVQGQEPRHFLKIFKGKLITFTGGHASGFKNIQDNDTYDVDGTRLFRIRGTCAEDVRAEQMPELAASLASDDVFVLETPNITYIWHGNGSSDFEKEMTASLAEILTPEYEHLTIVEGFEPTLFWDAIGGKGNYDHELDPLSAPFLEPRLFQCRILLNGKFRVEEICDYEQTDLDIDDIMVLDGGDEIYIWIGQGSSDEEKEKSMEMAKLYIQADPSERTVETVSIIKIHQGSEPRSFIRLFPSWDNDSWTSNLSYEQIRQQIFDKNEIIF